jgi:hypothetical protein
VDDHRVPDDAVGPSSFMAESVHSRVAVPSAAACTLPEVAGVVRGVRGRAVAAPFGLK